MLLAFVFMKKFRATKEKSSSPIIKCLLFTSQRHRERDCNLSLNLHGRSISCETTFKCLGVVFDIFMTSKAHADYVCKKMATRVSILGSVRSFLTKEKAILVY